MMKALGMWTLGCGICVGTLCAYILLTCPTYPCLPILITCIELRALRPVSYVGFLDRVEETLHYIHIHVIQGPNQFPVLRSQLPCGSMMPATSNRPQTDTDSDDYSIP